MANMKITSAKTNSNNLCCTCGNIPAAPYRVTDVSGKVINGCVDGCHTGKLIGESNRWHNRQEAEKVRRSQIAFRLAVA